MVHCALDSIFLACIFYFYLFSFSNSCVCRCFARSEEPLSVPAGCTADALLEILARSHRQSTARAVSSERLLFLSSSAWLAVRD